MTSTSFLFFGVEIDPWSSVEREVSVTCTKARKEITSN